MFVCMYVRMLNLAFHMYSVEFHISAVLISFFFSQHEGEEGISCIFDCKWSPDGVTFAAADSHGYLSVCGFGCSKPYEQVCALV